MTNIACVDLFCGAGGLTHGFILEKLNVVAGIDLDPACKYPFEKNNNAQFLERDVSHVTGKDLKSLFGAVEIKVLAGCAPCQPFSTYSYRYEKDEKDGKWGLLYHFARLAEESKPQIITMENVPSVENHKVFNDFVKTLQRLNYFVSVQVVDSSNYGVPQARKRLVLLASKFGEITMIPPTVSKPVTVREAIRKLPKLNAGEFHPKDRLHISASLSPKNLQRIQVSTPGGSWKDWPEHLIADCHKNDKGKTYGGVYGRMEWDKPAPTMTTQCFGFGNGRFGHPEQDRAITLREAAILQSFPKDYEFFESSQDFKMITLGRMIGNAVPVDLGRAIAKSIKIHLRQNNKLKL